MTRRASVNTIQHRIETEVSRSGQALSHLLGVPNQKIFVRLFANRTEYNQFRGYSTEGWEVANAMDKTIYLLSPLVWSKESTHKPSEVSRIIKHEVVHLLMDVLAGERLLPKWLSEGLANALVSDTKTKPCYLESGFTKKLDTPANWNKYANYDAYHTSYLFCTYLIRQYKLKRILELIRKLSLNYSYQRFSKIFKAVMGDDLEKAEEVFIQELP